MFGGCGKRPPAVKEASQFRDKGYQNYDKNMDEIFRFMIAKLRLSEYKRVDEKYDRAVAKAQRIYEKQVKLKAGPDGRVPAADAILLDKQKAAALKESEDLKIQLKSQIDQALDGTAAAYQKNKINLALANKINALIHQYDDAEVDLTAANAAIDELAKILTDFDVLKPQVPPNPNP